MNNVLDHSLPFEKYFEEICHIPHGSFNEQQLSDRLVSFAKNLGLGYKQYENGCVIIYKEGSPGYEDHDPVMLQGHMDMVCQKVPGCTHDFKKDPLDLYVEDGLIRARGTTLGADDGVGVAYMMAILASDACRHPFLECVFTVQEEVGCRGARVAANVIQPQTAVVIEATTCADVPGTPAEEQCTQLGNGPAFTIKDSGTITHKGLTQELIETAKTHGVPWQYKQTVSGGNDAFAIQTSGAGVKVASVSVPCRYIHAPVSVASMRDISALQTILNAWLLRDEKL